MLDQDHLAWQMNRRLFLKHSQAALGISALSLLLHEDQITAKEETSKNPLLHHPAKAKRIIYLCQSGAPSQLDLFDYKEELIRRQGEQLPESVRQGQRLTRMTSNQDQWQLLGSKYRFKQMGQSGLWYSELVPKMASIADEVCMIKTMQTEAINHDPAITLIQTGHQQPGRPSFGAWVTYGLGSLNENLPSYVVLTSRGSSLSNQQPLYDRLWSSGFLKANYQGVQLRSSADPVLFLNNPPGITAKSRKQMVKTISQLNQLQTEKTGNPEITARTKQYEMAVRMQMSVPELTDLSQETEKAFQLYGEDSKQPGTFAYNCLMARRLAERDVRFIQLYHRGWDQHTHLDRDLRKQCQDTDRASAALVLDLKQRGLLDDTIVIWGGEFGRTAYCQGEISSSDYGRDHHPRCYTIWLAGGGVKKGLLYGETDELGYNGIKDQVHVHDLNATLLHLLGIDHKRLTFRHQGRDFRLTDVHGTLIRPILA